MEETTDEIVNEDASPFLDPLHRKDNGRQTPQSQAAAPHQVAGHSLNGILAAPGHSNDNECPCIDVDKSDEPATKHLPGDSNVGTDAGEDSWARVYSRWLHPRLWRGPLVLLLVTFAVVAVVAAVVVCVLSGITSGMIPDLFASCYYLIYPGVAAAAIFVLVCCAPRPLPMMAVYRKSVSRLSLMPACTPSCPERRLRPMLPGGSDRQTQATAAESR
ncbi:hypothetical protein PENSPDRAFT_356911 [Peniophora sp. CONT]|nr:hypothetical protein PENSPDRAFT_356911 [Peniophora sp. CONT]